jgi:zinc and cadmium transporter
MVLLLYILASVFVVSLISFAGVLTLALSAERLQKILFILVSFAAGAMLGAAFFDLIPEAIEHGHEAGEHAAATIFMMVIGGFVLFFIFETFLFWYHCHNIQCERHTLVKGKHNHIHRHVRLPFTYLNLVGDGVHNFFDGVIIATSYLVSIPLGIVTTIAVICHEIPQEIGDFGLLVYGGFTRMRALFYNFLSAITAVLGAVIAYYFATTVSNFTEWLVPMSAGGFIYIATVDLLPELHQATRFKKAILQLIFFLLGLAVILFVTKFFAHSH